MIQYIMFVKILLAKGKSADRTILAPLNKIYVLSFDCLIKATQTDNPYQSSVINQGLVIKNHVFSLSSTSTTEIMPARLPTRNYSVSEREDNKFPDGLLTFLSLHFGELLL